MDISDQQADAALHASAERMRLALDAAGMGSFMWYPDEDRGEPDRQMLALFGLPADSTLNLTTALRSLIHPDDLERYATAVRRAVDPAGDGELQEEIRVIHPDGTQRWLVVTGRVAFSGHPRRAVYMAGVAADVTDRKRAEDARRLSAERRAFRAALSDALRTIADPVEIQAEAVRLLGERVGADRAFYAEITADGQACVIERGFHSEAVGPIEGRFDVQIFGLRSVEELRSGRTLAIRDVAREPVLTPAERATHEQLNIAAFVAVPLVKEERLVAVLGVHHRTPRQWRSDELALITDTAERTWTAVERGRAEEALRRSEERFRSIANASPTMIWATDPAGSITFHNRRWLDYAGDTVGQQGMSLLHPDDAARFREVWSRARATSDDYEFEARVRRHDGEYRWFLTRATAERSPSGRILQWIGSSTDIDDQKRREELERLAREQAELLAEVANELERLDGVAARARRLLELLVPRVAAFGSVELHGEEPQVFELGDRGARTTVRLAMGASAGLSLAPTSSAFDVEHADFAREVARRAGVLLESARLQEEEHRTALLLQRALLPGAVLDHPDVSIAARYDAGSEALEVGGDWYDSFLLPDGRIGLVVGDVVGHGLDAAAAMGRMRIALAAMATHTDRPGPLLSLLDEFASGPNGAEFTTACYAILDPPDKVLRYASAGHPPMLLVTPGGHTRWLDEGRSAPLGCRFEEARGEASVTVEAGSLLILYSDGLVERRRTTLSAGLDRLEQVARSLRDVDVSQACDRLVIGMGVDATRQDDVVVMCVRFTPARRFSRALSPDPGELAPLRNALRKWIDPLEVSPHTRNDLLVAVGEACANAIEHAYLDGGAGEVNVEIVEHGRDLLDVRVRDSGRWRPDGVGDDLRGRGTTLIEALAEGFSRHTDADGTTVTFRVDLRRDSSS